MNTPICDFVNKYSKKKANSRLHVPGHKGKGFMGIEKLDVTEINGADSLYGANGIILESEKNASTLFDCHTFYSTEGSSLSIRAMVNLINLYAREKGEKAKILSARNVHKSFLSAVALLDIDVDWYVENNNNNSSPFISQNISSEKLDVYLNTLKVKPTAFYLTSPDYSGKLLDICAISKICHKHDVLLMVDCAHGAYLKFISPSLFPIDLGADICCSSAHKTLPVLTGGAYLHISNNAPKTLVANAKSSLSLFGSTSPSYLILQSLDYANWYLYNKYKNKLNSFVQKISVLKNKLSDKGYVLCGNEPLKITIAPKPFGLSTEKLSQILLDNKLEYEFCDKDILVLMLTPENTVKSLKKIGKILISIKQKPEIVDKLEHLELPKNSLTIREAILSPTEIIEVNQSLGRIYAESNLPCPPAVPIIMCGEIINQDTIKSFTYYDIEMCKVVKN